MRIRLVVLLTIAGLVPAQACSCRPASRAQTVARADLVVTGTVVAVEVRQNRRRATLRVERVEKGPRLAEVEVRTAPSGPACGVAFRVGQRLTVAAIRDGAGYATNTCLQLGLGR